VVVFDLPNPEAVQNPDDEGLSITGLESRRDDRTEDRNGLPHVTAPGPVKNT